jgi:hypothetical protein
MYLAAGLENHPVSSFLHSSHIYYLHSLSQTLMTLKLNKNHIGDEGARYLANALQNNTVSCLSTINYLPF